MNKVEASGDRLVKVVLTRQRDGNVGAHKLVLANHTLDARREQLLAQLPSPSVARPPPAAAAAVAAAAAAHRFAPQRGQRGSRRRLGLAPRHHHHHNPPPPHPALGAEKELVEHVVQAVVLRLNATHTLTHTPPVYWPVA